MPFNNPSPTTLIAAQPVSSSISKASLGTFSSQADDYVYPPLVIDQGNTFLDRDTVGSVFTKSAKDRTRSSSGKNVSDTSYGMSTSTPEILLRFSSDDVTQVELDEYAKCIELETMIDAAQSKQFFDAIAESTADAYQERLAVVETLADSSRQAIFSMSDTLDSIDEVNEAVTMGSSQFTEGSQAKYDENFAEISDSIITNVSVRNPSLSFGSEKSSEFFDYVTSLYERRTSEYRKILTGSISVSDFVRDDKGYLDTYTSLDKTFSTLSQVLRKTIGESKVSSNAIHSSSNSIHSNFRNLSLYPFDGSATDSTRSAKSIGFKILDENDYSALDTVTSILSETETLADGIINNSALNLDDERYTPVGLFLKVLQATVNGNSSVADANTSLTIENPGQIWDSYLTAVSLIGGPHSNRYLQLLTDSLVNAIDSTSTESQATTTIADTLVEDESSDPTTRRIKTTTVVQGSSATSIDDVIETSDDVNVISSLYAASFLQPSTDQRFYVPTIRASFDSYSYSVDDTSGGKRESEFPRETATDYFESFKSFGFSGMYSNAGSSAYGEIYNRLTKFGSLDSGTITTEIKNFYSEILEDISSVTGIDSAVIEENGFAGVTKKNLISLIILSFAHVIALTLRPKFLRIEDYVASTSATGANDDKQVLYTLSFPYGATSLIKSIKDGLKTSGNTSDITQSIYLTYTSDAAYATATWPNDSFNVIGRYIKLREEQYDTFVKQVVWSKSIAQYLEETLVNFRDRISNNMAQLNEIATNAGVSFPIKFIRRNSVASRSFSLEHNYLLNTEESFQRNLSELYAARAYVSSILNRKIPIDIISIGLPVGFSETSSSTMAEFSLDFLRIDGLSQTSVEGFSEIIDTSIFVALNQVSKDANLFDILSGAGVTFHRYTGGQFIDSTYDEMIDEGYKDSQLSSMILSATRECAVNFLSSVLIDRNLFDETPYVSAEGSQFFESSTAGISYFPNAGLSIDRITTPFNTGWKVIPFSEISGTGTSLIDESSLRLCMKLLEDPIFTAETIARSIVTGPTIERIHSFLIRPRNGFSAMTSRVRSLPMREFENTSNIDFLEKDDLENLTNLTGIARTSVSSVLTRAGS